MRRVRPGNEINEKGEWFFRKERESLSCCDWFSMKLHEMMFQIKTFFDSDNNSHYFFPSGHGNEFCNLIGS